MDIVCKCLNTPAHVKTTYPVQEVRKGLEFCQALVGTCFQNHVRSGAVCDFNNPQDISSVELNVALGGDHGLHAGCRSASRGSFLE